MGKTKVSFFRTDTLSSHYNLILCFSPSVEVDGHFNAHTWQQREALAVIKNDDHRDALAHFGEVAAAVVLRWKQGEGTGCCAYDLADTTGERNAAIGIHMNID